MTLFRVFICYCFLYFLFITSGQSQADSIIIRHYQAASYKATAFNYSAIEDEKGVVYFANESGVLQYNGSQWKLFPLDNFSSANALLKVGERIYVGGRNELGYLEKNSLGHYTYHSLRHLADIKENEMATDIWQVISIEDQIYFCSWEWIFRYDGEKVNAIPADGAFIFKINNKLFASTKFGLAKVLPNRLEYVNRDFTFDNDMAFQYLAGLKGENFLITADNGIFLVDTTTYRTKKWKFEGSEALEKKSLYNVVIWPDSMYAISTYYAGLVLLNREGEVARTFTKESGLLGDGLRELLIDKRGNLWVTSDHGLDYLKRVDDKEEKTNLHTHVNELTINEKEIGITESVTHFATPPDYEGSVIFHFATPGFDRQELEYSYFLEGFEDSWSGWKPEVKKEYTHLDGGNYTFHVRARYGATESRAASFSLKVPMSWHRTGWAYSAFALILVTGVGYGINYKTKQLALTNKRLERIIYKRTRELEKQRKQLEASNADLMVTNAELDNFVYRSSHDLVAPLKSLKGLINISQLETNAESQKEYFRMMRLSIDKLEDFIKSIMEYSSNNKKEVVQEEIDLNIMLDDIVDDLKYYDRADKIELIRNVQDRLKLHSDPRRLKIILSNLITNSIKYHNYERESLYIEIKAWDEEGFIQIDVIDNGNGIAEEHLDKIFDMFFRATEKAQGSGLGLYIVRDTVRKLGGEIKVESKIGEGTTFSLLFSKTSAAVGG